MYLNIAKEGGNFWISRRSNINIWTACYLLDSIAALLLAIHMFNNAHRAYIVSTDVVDLRKQIYRRLEKCNMSKE